MSLSQVSWALARRLEFNQGASTKVFRYNKFKVDFVVILGLVTLCKHFFLIFSKGGRFVEHSILRCMTQRIRTARNFIYMENQYFLGSAYAWYEDQVIVIISLKNLIKLQKSVFFWNKHKTKSKVVFCFRELLPIT